MLFYAINILFNNFGKLSKLFFDKCNRIICSKFVLHSHCGHKMTTVFIDKMSSDTAAYSMLVWNVGTLYHNCITKPSLSTVVSIMHPHIVSVILYIPMLLAIGALSPSQSFVSSHLFFTLLKHNVSILFSRILHFSWYSFFSLMHRLMATSSRELKKQVHLCIIAPNVCLG